MQHYPFSFDKSVQIYMKQNAKLSIVVTLDHQISSPDFDSLVVRPPTNLERKKIQQIIKCMFLYSSCQMAIRFGKDIIYKQ